MSKIHHEAGAGPRAWWGSHFGQFPVDAYVRTIRLCSTQRGQDFVRIVVMSGLSTPEEAAYCEYHYNDIATSIDDVDSFVMRAGRLDDTSQAIAGFAGDMHRQFVVPQAPAWRAGARSPASPRRRLYKALDPDVRSKRIGVLLEQDRGGNLQSITWYKTDSSGALFRAMPETLSFELVRDEQKAPSTDPRFIEESTWYFTSSVADVALAGS